MKFKAHELGITAKKFDGNDIHLVIDRSKAHFFGRSLLDATKGSTAARKFENIVKLTYAPTRVHIRYS